LVCSITSGLVSFPFCVIRKELLRTIKKGSGEYWETPFFTPCSRVAIHVAKYAARKATKIKNARTEKRNRHLFDFVDISSSIICERFESDNGNDHRAGTEILQAEKKAHASPASCASYCYPATLRRASRVTISIGSNSDNLNKSQSSDSPTVLNRFLDFTL